MHLDASRAASLARTVPRRDGARAPGRRGARAVGARAAAGVVDQVVSSLTNFVVLFAALRTLSVSGLGYFTFVYTLSLLLVTVVRGLSLEPLLIRFSAVDSATRVKATAGAAGGSLVVGLGLSAVSLAVSLATHGETRSAAAGLAIVLPVLLVQDAWRAHLFAAAMPWGAVVNDAVCLAFTAAAVVVTTSLVVEPSVVDLVLVWGAGAMSGALLGITQSGTVPSPARALRWLSKNRDLGLPLAGERTAESSAAQVSFVVVGIVAQAAALGQLGASRAVMAPATTVIASVALFAVPEAVRLRDTRRTLTLFAAGLSLAISSAVLLTAAVLLLGPASTGHLLAGKNWGAARTLLLPVTLWTAAAGARRGPAVALRALERPGILLLLSLITGAALLPATAVGCAIAGAEGAAWAFALVYVASITMYWAVYLLAERRTPAAA